MSGRNLEIIELEHRVRNCDRRGRYSVYLRLPRDMERNSTLVVKFSELMHTYLVTAFNGSPSERRFFMNGFCEFYL